MAKKDQNTGIKNPKADLFFKSTKRWKVEFEKLRAITLSCPLTEEMKWMYPCYTHEGRNIVLIHGFKEYCAFLFFKGALLKDPKGILIQQTPNVQGPRQVRFTRVSEIMKQASVLKAYIQEAIEVEKSGTKVAMKKTKDFKVPEEFKSELAANPALKKAFDALTPGRQRGYLFYFNGAKQSQTRTARVDKCAPLILKGKGLDD